MISKTKLLSDPKIKAMYSQYLKQQSGKGRKQVGAGIFDGFVKFLKDSKVLSTVGGVLLPVAGGLAAGLVTANPLAGAVGAAAGSSANTWIKSQGFGKRQMKGGGGVLRSGQIPLHKMTGCGHVQHGRGTNGGVYNSIGSAYGKIRV